MENPFNLSDENLKTLLDNYFLWCNKNEDEGKYPELERQKAKERKNTLLNKDFIQKLTDDELADKILEYSKSLEGPVNIRIGRPRVI